MHPINTATHNIHKIPRAAIHQVGMSKQTYGPVRQQNHVITTGDKNGVEHINNMVDTQNIIIPHGGHMQEIIALMHSIGAHTICMQINWIIADTVQQRNSNTKPAAANIHTMNPQAITGA